MRIYQPKNEPEAAMLRSILTTCGIPHFVQNDHFAGLLVGPMILHVNVKAICVEPDWAEEASAVVRDYLEATGDVGYCPTGADKIRNVLEFLFFRWFVPCSQRTVESSDEDEDQVVG